MNHFRHFEAAAAFMSTWHDSSMSRSLVRSLVSNYIVIVGTSARPTFGSGLAVNRYLVFDIGIGLVIGRYLGFDKGITLAIGRISVSVSISESV